MLDEAREAAGEEEDDDWEANPEYDEEEPPVEQGASRSERRRDSWRFVVVVFMLISLKMMLNLEVSAWISAADNLVNKIYVSAGNESNQDQLWI